VRPSEVTNLPEGGKNSTKEEGTVRLVARLFGSEAWAERKGKGGRTLKMGKGFNIVIFE